jgi:hypothetical protein
VLFEQWAAGQHLWRVYSAHDTWDSMLQQGIQLLERFVKVGATSALGARKLGSAYGTTATA